MLADLDLIEWRIDAIEDGPGSYHIKMRSQLDRTGMPGLMQLPMLFSSDWVHDSGWVSQELEINRS